MGNLVVEIGVEEIPALLVRSTLDQLRDRATTLFRDVRLAADAVESYGSPRRLVLSARLGAKQQAQVTQVTGPPKVAAYERNGKPSAAAIGFANAQGVRVETLTVVRTDRGEYLAAQKAQPALPTEKVLRELLPTLISQLEFPKTMRWNDAGERFIRPVRWILALFDREVIPFSFAGIRSGRRSFGHRWLAPDAVTIRRADEYRTRLARACVLVDDHRRKAQISRRVQARAKTLRAIASDQPVIVEQAVYTTEWPVVVTGAFDRRYLKLPRNVLLAVLEHQQGYFSLQRSGGELLPRFLCVIDGGGGRGAMGHMVRGHERVLKARLEDAQFYVRQDQAVRLSDRLESLKTITFHERLGSVHEKVTRMVELAERFARPFRVDRAEAIQAARLCKADLVTGMVREFPELQGVMGGDYAARQGEPGSVALAIGEHYRPRSTGDPLPATPLGQLLSLVDKTDTVVGYFGIGLAPTGSEDPYALRRQGAGLVQILGTHPTIDVREIIESANDGFVRAFRSKGTSWKSAVQSVFGFLTQRLEWQLQSEGFRADLVAAMLSRGWSNPSEVRRKLSVLVTVLSRPVGDDVMTGYRRVGRIVPKEFSSVIDPSRFAQPEEAALHEACQRADSLITAAQASSHDREVLEALAQLRPAIDAFFNKVFVMVEETAVRTNRLALVNQAKTLFDQYADFSKVTIAEHPLPETARTGVGVSKRENARVK